MSGVLLISGVSNFWPAIAVPMTVKIPEPMTAPMPRAVSDQGPSDFFSACSGSSDSRMSLSMDLQASSWLGNLVFFVVSLEVSGIARRSLKTQCTWRGTEDEIREEVGDRNETASVHAFPSMRDEAAHGWGTQDCLSHQAFVPGRELTADSCFSASTGRAPAS